MKKIKTKLTDNAIAYLRVSTDRQEISMQVQEEKIRAYCVTKGFVLKEVLREPDVSGKIRLYDRPEGSRIKNLLAGGCSHVIALKLDRLFRNAGDALTVSEEWLEQGASLHIVDMSGSAIDTGSPQGRMFFTMLAGFAEFERGMISERTSAALRYKKENNKVYCKEAPYGMDAVGPDLIKNEAEIAALGKMVDLRESGKSYREIASELKKSGIAAKHGGEWHPFAISRIIEATR